MFMCPMCYDFQLSCFYHFWFILKCFWFHLMMCLSKRTFCSVECGVCSVCVCVYIHELYLVNLVTRELVTREVNSQLCMCLTSWDAFSVSYVWTGQNFVALMATFDRWINVEMSHLLAGPYREVAFLCRWPLR